MASHDLQEPLRTVKSYKANSLPGQNQGQAGARRSDAIGLLVAAAWRMRPFINDLLACARLGLARASRRRRRSRLDHARRYGRASSSRSRKARPSSTEGTLPTVTADPRTWRRVFQNLVSNAIKFRRLQPPRFTSVPSRTRIDWPFSRARQRHRHRPGVHRPHLRDLPAAAHPQRIPWHGHRPGHLQEDRRAAWRPHLGRIQPGQGRPSSSRSPDVAPNSEAIREDGRPRTALKL